jgi:Iron-sulfur cluster-binding domain
LQRLVFFTDKAIGLARPDQALYEQLSGEEAVHIDRAAALARSLGIDFSASGGASEPGVSLKRSDNGGVSGSPWSLCRRPWTVMYFTANGRALPCCITQQSLREIWTGPAYVDFRKALKSNTPPEACASCGLRWSL